MSTSGLVVINGHRENRERTRRFRKRLSVAAAVFLVLTVVFTIGML